MAKFLFRNKKWIGTETNKIEADVFLSSTPTYSRQVPMHPVQGKTQVADTIVKDPISLSVKGLITQTPIGGIIANPLALIGRKQKVKLLYTKLQDLYHDTSITTIISIVDGDQTYTNMTLQSLTLPKTPEDGDAFEFTATFVELNIVKKSFVDVEGLNDVNGDGSKSDMANKVNKGSVVKEAVKAKTLALQAVEAIVGEENLTKFADLLTGK